MFTFYKFDVVGPRKWVATFLQDDKVTEIKNKGALERLLSKVNYLVGYNNYTICDKLLASALKGLDPYDTLKKIETRKRVSFNLQNPISIDLKQEINADLDEIKYNLGYGTSTDDLEVMKEVFEFRDNYLSSKFEVVKEFNLRPENLKLTRVMLASDVLKTRKGTDKNRLNISYDKKLSKQELPKPLIQFYERIEKGFENGQDFKELERERFIYKLGNLDHTFGFGGLHAAKENYIDEGHFMQIDFKAYYPSIILNNKYLDEKAHKYYEAIYNDRLKLQRLEDKKEEAYKLIVNIVYGGLKAHWTRLYNPQISNSVVVNGQLIITHLILLLDNFCELIQTNTDGLIIKFEPVMKDSILKIIELFEQHYKLKFDINYINKIAQKDVNNYVMRYTNNEIHAVGRFANHEGGSYERNSYAIIDKALVDYYMRGIRVNRTVMNEYKNNNLALFQYVIKSGTYDGIAQESFKGTLFDDVKDTHMKDVDTVARVFAGRNKDIGSMYRFKDGRETRYTKVAYTSDHCLVWNDSLDKLNKRNIDLNWYIKEVERWLF